MKTIKKAVLLSYLVNEYGMECPIPLEFWPEGAKVSVADDEKLLFCWSKVEYDERKGYWWCDNLYDIQGTTVKHNFKPEQYKYAVWHKPKD